ncbi:MAG: PIN domain-containing protein [Nitrospirota bacterium]|jgi:predicted nucleic acid-binding protein
MRLLIDANIFLEVILEQEKAGEARELLKAPDDHELFVSDYAVHSIGLLLFRRKQHDIFREFVKDMIFDTGIEMMSLFAEDMDAVINRAQRFRLDFDDAYQYVTSERYNLTIISFDNDFDRTERGRKTPAEVLYR